ncbi:MAG TPA: MipA/OmpV family protein, partial [Nitrospirota bacterium]|nr:MipA/OmpV family protein [Nitrospirota bacterium]
MISERAWARCLLLLSSMLVLPQRGVSAELPEWEAGAGATVFSMPDYRGSDRSQTRVYPIPYLVYRGETLKIEKSAIRGIFYTSDRIEVDTSITGAPPVKSEGSGIRQGMPDLDATLEIGPSLKVVLERDTASGYRAELQFPLRMSVATDLSYLRSAGYIFNPRLNFDWARLMPSGRWSAGFAVGPVFIDTRNARHYYSVDIMQALPVRPRYDAHGGYAGAQLALSGTIRKNNLWVGIFSRVDSLHDARFEDSPLVRRRWNVTAGIAVSWVIGTSDTLVPATEW